MLEFDRIVGCRMFYVWLKNSNFDDNTFKFFFKSKTFRIGQNIVKWW